MTSKEISQRLKEVGFDIKGDDFTFYCHKCNLWEPDRYTMTSTDGSYEDFYHCVKCNTELDMIDRYDAETLFKWLRENVGKDKKHPYDYFIEDDDGFMFNHQLYGDSNDPNNNHDSPAFAYKTSLVDMLGEAIIWIKEQENE